MTNALSFVELSNKTKIHTKSFKPLFRKEGFGEISKIVFIFVHLLKVKEQEYTADLIKLVLSTDQPFCIIISSCHDINWLKWLMTKILRIGGKRQISPTVVSKSIG